ncbi:MAG: hypothetical protein ACJAQX_001183 [Polaribacter sp.]|jgi:hypothetical protein
MTVVIKTITGNLAQLGKKAFFTKKRLPTAAEEKIKEITPETIMAESSLHALIRHENHLKIKINSVP